MEICGYSKRKNGDYGKFVNLKECSIICTSDELDNICKFLEYVRESHNSGEAKLHYCHSHYIDWCKSDENVLSDLIIITNIDK